MPTSDDSSDLPDEIHIGMQALEEMLQQAAGGWLPDPAADVELPHPPDELRVVVMRVDVDHARPPVWRRLQVRGDITMDRFHHVLQAVFGWWDAHLHRFWLGPSKQIWSGPYLLTDFDVQEGEQGVHEAEVRLDQLVREEGDRVFYTYDFGDEWNHTVTVESLAPATGDTPEAVCVGGRRHGPIEDIGGVHAHNDLVADPDQDATDPYTGEPFDPAAFDLDDANGRVAIRLAAPDGVQEVLRQELERGGEVHPGVAEVLANAPRDLQALVLTACEQVPDVTPEVQQAGLVGFTRLLEMAVAQPIELTAAGWMRPAVVETLFTELRMDEFWIGKGNREDYTAPVALLRETAQQMGLLHKRKRKLLVTTRGRDLHQDPEALWLRLVGSLLPAEPGAERDARVLLLVRAALGRAMDDVQHDDIAADLTALGWREEGDRPVGRWTALGLHRDAWDVLRLVHDIAEAADDDGVEVTAALSLAALRG